MPPYLEKFSTPSLLQVIICLHQVLPSLLQCSYTETELQHRLTINVLNQLVVSVELCSSRAISLHQISFPNKIKSNEIKRFINRGNWVNLIVLESGKTFNLTASCIPLQTVHWFTAWGKCITKRTHSPWRYHECKCKFHSRLLQHCYGDHRQVTLVSNYRFGSKYETLTENSTQEWNSQLEPVLVKT